MSNEEKILLILENMQSDIAGLKEGQGKINERLDRLEAGQKAIRKDIAGIKHELKEYVWEDIRRLSEQIKPIDGLEKRVERVEVYLGIR